MRTSTKPGTLRKVGAFPSDVSEIAIKRETNPRPIAGTPGSSFSSDALIEVLSRAVDASTRNSIEIKRRARALYTVAKVWDRDRKMDPVALSAASSIVQSAERVTHELQLCLDEAQNVAMSNIYEEKEKLK